LWHGGVSLGWGFGICLRLQTEEMLAVVSACAVASTCAVAMMLCNARGAAASSR
jgi:hypothetical protein